MDHYLTLDERRSIVVPPSPRRALTSKSSPHPLAPLFCAPADALSSGPGCGQETLGWRRRADRALGRSATIASVTPGSKTEESCAKEANAEEPSKRYTTYRDCLEEVAPRREALPLGRFKAP